MTKPNSNRTSCFNCHSTITKEEIRISFKKYDHFRYYHLPCFDPPEYHFIKSEDLEIVLKQKQDEETVEAWRTSWNSKFFPLDPAIPISVQTEKVLKTRPSKISQVFRLVFRFLTIDELVNYAELTCKSFYHAAWDDSLWELFMFREFGVGVECKGLGLRPRSRLREKYAQESLERCVRCKTKKDLKRSELLERNICSNCKGNFRNDYISRSQVMVNHGFDPFKWGFLCKSFDGCTRYYSEIYLRKKVLRFRRQNKEKVLKMLVEVLGSDAEFIQIIKDINFENMDKKVQIKMGIYKTKEKIIPAYNENFEPLHSYKLIFDYIRTGKFKKLSDSKALNQIQSELTPNYIYH